MNKLPKAEKIKKRRFSPVWLTPVLALVITGWLLYSGYVNSGVDIRVQFDSGSGLKIGRTPLKYRGIDIGKVVNFEIADTLDRVNVVIRLEKEAEGVAKEGMKFWIVKPQFSVDRITGLETIISGAYIEVEPPSYDIKTIMGLKDKDFFIGLKEPPRFQFGEGAVRVELSSDEDPKLFRGMTVFYNSMEAGKITLVEYNDKTKKYEIFASVKSRYRKYINESTKFWSVNGVDISYDASGFRAKTEPILSLLHGGIEFRADYADEKEKPLNRYRLYERYEHTLLCDNSLYLSMPETYGVKGDATPLIYKGMKVGLVTSVGFEDGKSNVFAEIKLLKGFEWLAREESLIVLRSPKIDLSGVRDIGTAVTGVYLEILPGRGDLKSDFVLHEKPILETGDNPLKFTLRASEKGSVGVGTPILFKGVEIGVISGFLLDKREVAFDAYIFDKYRRLAKRGLYFWEPDFFRLSMAGGVIDVKSSSVKSLVKGAVYAGYLGYEGRREIKTGASVKLYRSENAAREAHIRKAGIAKLHLFAETADGISQGAPVLYRGVRVGELGNSYLVKNTGKVRVTVLINPDYKYLLNGKAYFWKSSAVGIKMADGGIKIKTPQISQLISGGVEFENDAPGLLSVKGRPLYSDRESASKELKIKFAEKIFRLYTRGITIPASGAPVYHRGVKAGSVADVGYDVERGAAYADVVIDKDFLGTLTGSTRFWKGGNVEIKATGDGVRVRAEPAASYLTGALHYSSFEKSGLGDYIYKSEADAEKPDHAAAVLTMKRAYGLKEGAAVVYKGIRVGYLDSIKTVKDTFEAEVFLYSEHANYLREGAVFWVESVVASAKGLVNADSIIFGPKIFMLPGSGDEKADFEISDRPVSPYHGKDGLRLTVKSENRNSLDTGSPIFFRQVQVGAVEWVKLSENGEEVELGVFIESRYSHLVRKSSVFSPASGIDFSFGLFSGLKLKTGTVKTLLVGGMSFSTSDMSDDTAVSGDTFIMKRK